MTHGIVCAAQPEAVEAGAITLRRGGNAIDAAVACALTQGVVDPLMTGLGGVGTAIVRVPGHGFAVANAQRLATLVGDLSRGYRTAPS